MSWIIIRKATGEVVAEWYDKQRVDALNRDKYHAVPAMEYLGELNRMVREANATGVDKCKGYHWPTTGQLHNQCRNCAIRSPDQTGHNAPQWIGGLPTDPCILRIPAP